jgi:peptidoglycan-associated lipoprotein
MKGIAYRGAAAGAAILTALALSACATERYVDEAVAGVQTQVTANTARISEHDQRLASLDGRVAAVQARADSAYNLAAGRFVSEKIADETLLYETGKFMLTDAHKAQLTALSDRLKSENKNVYLEVEGFADARGDERANRWLSVRRAYGVYDYLRDQGIGLHRMQVIGHGEENPIAPDATAAGREQNRRVTITIVG